MSIQEITLTIGNRPGNLQGVAKLLAEWRINVAAISLSSFKQKSTIKMVVSDTERALWLLRKAGYKAEATELLVVRMEDKSGSMLRVLDILAQHKINVEGAMILVTREGQKVLIGLDVSTPQRARKRLLDAGFLSSEAKGLISNSGLVSSNLIYNATESVGLLL